MEGLRRHQCDAVHAGYRDTNRALWIGCPLFRLAAPMQVRQYARLIWNIAMI